MSSNNFQRRAEALFNQGVELYEKTRFRAAERKLKKALRLFPSSEDIMYNLALVYLETKKFKLASKLVNEIKETDCQDIINELNKHSASLIPPYVFWAWLITTSLVFLVFIFIDAGAMKSGRLPGNPTGREIKAFRFERTAYNNYKNSGKVGLWYLQRGISYYVPGILFVHRQPYSRLKHLLVSIGLMIGLIYGIRADKKKKNNNTKIHWAKSLLFGLTIWGILWLITTAVYFL